MKRVNLFYCLCVSVIISSTGYANMQGSDFLPTKKWWHKPGVVKALKITHKEKTILDREFHEKQKTMIRIDGEMKIHKLDMEALIESEPLKEKAVMDKLENILDTSKKMYKKQLKFLIEVRKLLGKKRFMKLKNHYKKSHGKYRRGKKEHRKGKNEQFPR
ncbi:conserved hypothetical protein, secreted [Candidatus Magnetomorum sp. HK-1]|nr:conserved hypothetical protein, secreted [Candidatus Magnetomorum sp. HK-1]